MTMASIANITRYTDPKEYELILMSNDEKFPVRDDYKVLKIDTYWKTQGYTYTQAMNLGAEKATYDILAFIQNDVFVWEGWLKNLRYYIEKQITDCIFPDQCPRDREFVKKSYSMNYEEAMKYGSRDAGLFLIRKDAFKKTGGWNEELTLLAEKDFYERMGNNGVRMNDTCKVMISHIMAATNLDRLDTNPEEYNRMMEEDAKKTNR